MEKGIRISNKEYREREGVSSSDLKKLMKSPAHFRYWKDNPQEDTPALLFGRSAHKYMLEKSDFFNEFAVAPNCDRRTKDGKAEWQLFQESNTDKDIITIDDFDKIEEMHKALYETPFVAKLLQGVKELSFFTTDDDTGLTIKCRPDCITEVDGNYILIDYKTCNDAEDMKFYRDSIKFGYDLQMAYYMDILQKVTGKEFQVVIIAQEKTAPYEVNVFELTEDYLENGRDLYKELLNVYKECLETDNWYGYMKNGISVLGQPSDEDVESEE